MTRDKAEEILTNAVYEAGDIFERLENDGQLIGSGHHVRQSLCEAALALLRERFKEQEG